MSQITLRKIPVVLDKQLRSMAIKNRTSLNKTILSLLMKSQGLTENSDKKRDLSKLFGTWSRDQYEEFQRNTEEFNRIDPEIWK